jgi:hypothetical protein
MFLLSVHPSGRWLVGAVGIENNGVRNFRDLRGMTRNAKSLKKKDEAWRGILIAPSKLLRFSSGIEIPTAWDFRPLPLSWESAAGPILRRGWQAGNSRPKLWKLETKLWKRLIWPHLAFPAMTLVGNQMETESKLQICGSWRDWNERGLDPYALARCWLNLINTAPFANAEKTTWSTLDCTNCRAPALTRWITIGIQHLA